MTRFGKILGAAFFTALLSGNASAASQATIKSASEGVQLGKEGDWKSAKPGMSIADTDFVKIPDGAAATITLPDNSSRDFKGKAVIPGRRLGDKTNAGISVWFSQSVQKVAGTGTTTTKANGITKAGVRKRDPIYDSATQGHMSAESAEYDFAYGAYERAAEIAREVVANPDAPPLEKRRAHLVLGECFANSASYTAALKDLDIAAEPTVATEGPEVSMLRVSALLQRGQVQTQLGNDKAAQEDFKIVATSSDKLPAAQAKFLLGILAFGSKDPKTARNWFDQLKGSEESLPLYEAGMAMLEPPK